MPTQLGRLTQPHLDTLVQEPIDVLVACADGPPRGDRPQQRAGLERDHTSRRADRRRSHERVLQLARRAIDKHITLAQCAR